MTEDALAGLVAGYERELALYGRLLDVARAAAEDPAHPRSVDRVLEGLREKGRLLAEIGEVEAGLAPLKERWERGRGAAPSGLVAALNGVLERIARTLEEILAVEDRAARGFAVREGVGLAGTPLEPAVRAARYEDGGARGMCVSVRG